MPKYVVQMQVTRPDAEGNPLWDDIAEIDAPAKTKRKTVITQALKQADIEGRDGLLVRVLDSDSAKTSTVSYRQPPPELEISPSAWT